MSRVDGRSLNELRPVTLERGFLRHAEGSVLITQGDTKVVCAASVEDRVPIWLRGKGQGWVTAEYSMLPRATTERVMREATRGKVGGRTHEIQRLIGRALRSVIDLRAFPDKTIWIDCDVIQADGGTRTASVTGAFIALVEALASLAPSFRWERLPLADWVAATSVGIVDGEPMLDLCYNEDVNAQVDMNVVMTETGRLIEVQGTAEGAPFTRDEMTAMMDLADEGVGRLVDMGREGLSDLAPLLPPPRAREGGSSA